MLDITRSNGGADEQKHPPLEPSTAANVPESHDSGSVREVYYNGNQVRALLCPLDKRYTFTYDALRHCTTLQTPLLTDGVSLTYCESQKTTTAAKLCQFAKHIEYRVLRNTSECETAAGEFIEDRQLRDDILRKATGVLGSPKKRGNDLDDVTQEAKMLLWSDLKAGKAVFQGDDPEEFRKWIGVTTQNKVIDAVKHGLNGKPKDIRLTNSEFIDPPSENPADDVIQAVEKRELVMRTNECIEKMTDPEMREVMRDRRDEIPVRETAGRMEISKWKVEDLRIRGIEELKRALGGDIAGG